METVVRKRKKLRYIFEYNMLTINILSFALMFLCIYGNGLVEKLLNVNFAKTVGIHLLIDSTDAGIKAKIFAFIVIAVVAILAWFILHEIIHAVAYRVMGAKKKDISFGVVLEKGIFYCRCDGFVNKKCIIVSLLAPFILIGVLTYIIGIIFNIGWLVYLSLLNIMGCAGDLAMFTFFIRRKKDIRFRELDDSTVFCLETRENLKNKKFLFVKLRDTVDEEKLEDTKNKLINISKVSWIIFGILVALLILSLLLVFV